MAIASGLRDIILGIGFLIGWDQITRTLIFQNYNELIPGITGHGAGVMFVLVGLGVIVASLKYNRQWAGICLKIQAYAWLFSTLMYTLNGYWALAFIFGIFFCLPAGYSSFYVRAHPAIDEQIKDVLRSNDAKTI